MSGLNFGRLGTLPGVGVRGLARRIVRPVYSPKVLQTETTAVVDLSRAETSGLVSVSLVERDQNYGHVKDRGYRLVSAAERSFSLQANLRTGEIERRFPAAVDLAAESGLPPSAVLKGALQTIVQPSRFYGGANFAHEARNNETTRPVEDVLPRGLRASVVQPGRVAWNDVHGVLAELLTELGSPVVNWMPPPRE